MLNQAVHNVIGGAAYQIENSLMIDADGSGYLYYAPVAGNEKTWTFNRHVKRSVFGSFQHLMVDYSAGGIQTGVRFDTNDNIEIYHYDAGYIWRLVTTAKYRDPSYHMDITVALDTTEATASDRVKLWVDGVRVTDFSTETYPTLNYAGCITSTTTSTGSWLVDYNWDFGGYYSNVIFVAGVAGQATDFGEWHPDNDKLWRPKNPSAIVATGDADNTYWLDFKDGTSITTLAYDVSGNANHGFIANMGIDHQSTDTPTNNAAIWDANQCHASAVLSEGNRKHRNVNNGWYASKCTYALEEGKWYFETRVDEASANNRVSIGLGHSNTGLNLGFANGIGDQATCMSLNRDTSYWRVWHGGAAIIDLTALPTGVVGSILQIAFDVDTGKVWVGINNTWQGSPSAGTGAVITSADFQSNVVPMIDCYQTGAGTVRFNEGDLSYTPPTGFLTIESQNFAAPTIKDPEEYFSATIYTGNGASRTIATPNKVDIAIIKNRDQADEWKIVDSVRGATKELSWDSDALETTDSNGLTAFGSTSGFNLGTGAGGYNDNAEKFVAHSLTSNTAAGIKALTWVGDSSAGHTVAHGCGQAPELLMVKNRDSASTNYWTMYHKGLGGGKGLYIGTSGAVVTSSAYWNNTAPDATNITLGSGGHTNYTGNNYICYAMFSVEGMTKVFEYTGNNSTDGPFIHLGFKPAFWMVKGAGTQWWFSFAAPPNYAGIANSPYLHPNATSVEQSGTRNTDILANGLKIRATVGEGHYNQSGVQYYGIAFAEIPFALINNGAL